MAAHSLLLALLLSQPQALPTERLHLGNGYGIAGVSAASGTLTRLQTQPYAERTPKAPAINVARGCFAGISVDGGGGIWLRDRTPKSVAWQPRTGAVQVVHQVGSVTVRTTWLSPWGLHRPAIAMFAQVENTSIVGDREVTIAAFLDFALGQGSPEAGTLAERIEPIGPSLLRESGRTTAHRMVYRALPTANQSAIPPQDPLGDFSDLGKLRAGGGAGDVLDPVDGDNIVAAFARGPLTLAPGESTWLTVVSAYGTSADEDLISAELDTWIAGRMPGALLADELDQWQSWQAADRFAAEVAAHGAVLIDPDELAVWRQGLVSLRMSQVREASLNGARPQGQIVAALSAGLRNRATPRDMAYAITALSRTGFQDEAWDALEFMLRGQAGRLSAEVGGDYAVSVSRYFGDGSEDTRSAADPTVAALGWDNFGLALWALGQWADRQATVARVEPFWPDVRDGIAGVLTGLIESSSGLLRPDGSVWERPGPTGRHHTFSNITAVAGLCAASRLATRLGDAQTAANTAQAASTLRQAILDHLVDPATGVLVGALEDVGQPGPLDLTVAEAINFGLLSPTDPTTVATLNALEALVLTSGGYPGTDDPEDMNTESVFASLRLAAALATAGRQFAADSIVERVTNAARGGFDQVPEHLSPTMVAFGGGVPSNGFGAASLALARLPGQAVMDASGCLAWVPPVGPTPDPGPEAGPDTAPDTTADAAPVADRPPFVPPKSDGGGCGGAPSAPAAPFIALLLLGVLALARRRRPLLGSVLQVGVPRLR